MSVSKPKFRSRKLDFKRQMPILFAQDIPNFDELDSALEQQGIGRSVPLVATGVEKEEEEEHHLQQAMQSTQDSDTAQMYIPTPDASRVIDYYQQHYNKLYPLPKSLIRHNRPADEAMGTPIYCMDEHDLQWLDEYNSKRSEDQHLTPLIFETYISELDLVTDRKVKQHLTLHNNEMTVARREQSYWASFGDLNAYILIHPPPSSPNLQEIFQYWLQNKKLKDGRSLMPILKMEEGPKSESDPFVCFRKREIKNTRKTRRTDVQSLQRLRQLRAEMDTARVLVEMVAKREKMRRELLLLEHVIFEQRSLIQQIKERLNLPEDVLENARAVHRRLNSKNKAPSPARQYVKKRRISSLEEEAQDPLSVAVRAEVNKRRVLEAEWIDATEIQLSCRHPAVQYEKSDLTISHRGQSVTRGRYRIGRGGRMIIDRTSYIPPRHNDNDTRWKFDDMENAEQLDTWQSFGDRHVADNAQAQLFRLSLL